MYAAKNLVMSQLPKLRDTWPRRGGMPMNPTFTYCGTLTFKNVLMNCCHIQKGIISTFVLYHSQYLLKINTAGRCYLRENVRYRN